MPAVEIIRLDADDDAALDAAVAVWRAAHEADEPDGPLFSPSSARGAVLHPCAEEENEYWLAVDSGVVGVLRVAFPVLDNLDGVFANVTVHPGARRRGVGRALHGQLVARMRERHRKLATAFFRAGESGVGFARAVGAELATPCLRNRLEVDDAALRTARRIVSEPRPPGYEIRTYAGASPETYVDDLAYLSGRLSTDMPMDDLEQEPEVFDAARVRDREAAYARWGWRIYTAVAVHLRSGRLAGFTNLWLTAEDPVNGHIGDTLVDPDHRGHGLGALLKAEHLLFVRAHEPELGAVFTFNAESNAPMLAVNTALGYRPLYATAGWQFRL